MPGVLALSLQPRTDMLAKGKDLNVSAPPHHLIFEHSLLCSGETKSVSIIIKILSSVHRNYSLEYDGACSVSVLFITTKI